MDKIRLLSFEEFHANYKIIPTINEDWWLSSPSKERDRLYATYVALDTCDSEICHANLGVRPALQTEIPLDLNPGDKTELYGHTWTVLDENTALCDDIIGFSKFREESKAPDATDYEKSDVKQFVENWLNEKMNEYSENKEIEDISEELD